MEGNLVKMANEIRKLIVKTVYEAGSGHVGGPLGVADLFALMYLGEVLKDEDRFVLSAGHYCPVLYASLAMKGLIEEKELFSLRKLKSRLQGHPHFEMGGKGNVPGVEVTAGPLGQGVSQAIGMALAMRMDNKKGRIFCFMGDGEQNEGQVWEAYMLAGSEKLAKLVLIIDRNNMQIDGTTDQVMPLEPLRDKLAAFNLEVREVDGHNMEQMRTALERESEKTVAIILKTIPGKGVSFMENDYRWHGKVPNEKEMKQALKELEISNF